MRRSNPHSICTKHCKSDTLLRVGSVFRWFVSLRATIRIVSTDLEPWVVILERRSCCTRILEVKVSQVLVNGAYFCSKVWDSVVYPFFPSCITFGSNLIHGNFTSDIEKPCRSPLHFALLWGTFWVRKGEEGIDQWKLSSGGILKVSCYL